MRKASILVGLAVAAIATTPATARAQTAAPTVGTGAEAAPAPAPVEKRIQLGISFLPMGLGKFTASIGGNNITSDASFAYGLGLSANYVLVHGLTLGFAPQSIFNVKVKDSTDSPAKQVDLMVRVAYAFDVGEATTFYLEALPGYSLIIPPQGDTAKGLVFGLGAGGTVELGGPAFANLGVGYQWGFQKRTAEGLVTDVNTKYLRVVMGAGVRF